MNFVRLGIDLFLSMNIAAVTKKKLTMEERLMEEKAVVFEGLNMALKEEEQGNIDRGLQLIDLMLDRYQSEKEMLLIEKAKMLFRTGSYREALLAFVEIYRQFQTPEVLALVLEAYYYPNIDFYTKNYEKNQELFERSKNCFIEKEIEVILPIFVEEDLVVLYNETRNSFIEEHYENMQSGIQLYIGVGNIICNCFPKAELINKIKKYDGSNQEEKKVGVKYAVGVYYNQELFAALRKVLDLTDLVETEQVVLIVGKEGIRDCMMNGYFLEKNCIIGMGCNVVKQHFVEAYDFIAEEGKEKRRLIEEYYDKNKQQIIGRVRAKKPRVLIVTSLYTNVLQYHARDCMRSLQEKGIPCRMLCEKSRYQNLLLLDYYKAIIEFEPDVLFALDAFFCNLDKTLGNFISVNWVQDPMPEIMNKSMPSKLGENVFILNHFISSDAFFEIGYPEEKLIDGPIPANHKKYHPMEMSLDEKNKYGSDICFVCHASDTEGVLKYLLMGESDEIIAAITTIFIAYREYVFKTGKLLYRRSEFEKYIRDSLTDLEIKMSDSACAYWAYQLFQSFNQRVYRQALVNWLLEAGYTNIKLWGSGWDDDEKYRPYAMGVAENGETLSKIYQASKIVVGNNVQTSAAARAWESMLSGAFYLANYIPPECDLTDIRKILSADQYVMFNGKEDFLKKIDYYLTHEEERKRMADIGREAALQKMTFDKTMERMLDALAERVVEW